MSKTKAPYVMYTPNLFFYYEELITMSIYDNTVIITYKDPYGDIRTDERSFFFYKNAKKFYDEIIKVNNVNKEMEKKNVRLPR